MNVKMKMRKISIRWKLAAAYLLLIVMILGAADIFLLQVLERQYLRERETAALANANIIATTEKDKLLSNDRNAYYAARSFGTRLGVRVLATDTNGKVTVDSFGEGWLEGRVLQYQEVLTALGGISAAGVHQLDHDEKVMYVAVPIMNEKLISGTVLLVVDLNDVYVSLDHIRGQMLAALLAGGILAGLLSLWLAGRLTRPVEELTTAARQMSRGHLDQRIRVRSQDELGQMARAFNDMSGRLAEVDRTRRRFLADASHELKTPLSAVKALAQSLIDTDEQDPGVYKEYLEDINQEVDRLARIVDDMLHLARLEEDESPLVVENEDVEKLIQRTLILMKPRADNQGVLLESQLSDHLYWPVNSDLFSRMLINLLDNAIRHTPAGGKIMVQGKQNPSTMTVAVVDTGEGIAQDDLPYIFERFFRADKARSRRSGGTGLGLAIVRQAVQRHGGSIAVQSELGQGTKFEMVFPMKG